MSPFLLPNNTYQVSTTCRHSDRCWECKQDLDPVLDGEGLVREMNEETTMIKTSRVAGEA